MLQIHDRTEETAMRIGWTTLLLLVALLAAATTNSGAATTGCLDLTGTTALSTKPIVANLGLTRDQVREARARLSSYGSLSGFKGLDGLGLTAEQRATILRRIKAQVAANTHPLGWPCPAFTNRAKVVQWVAGELVANGFRPRMQQFGTAARQIRIRGIQDGIAYLVLVVRQEGRRQILVALTPAGTGPHGGTYRYVLPFDA